MFLNYKYTNFFESFKKKVKKEYFFFVVLPYGSIGE